VGIANAGDGSGRLFVLVRSGAIRVVQGGQLLDAPFLDITDKVGSGNSEQGLLGMAFHPNYHQNGLFYIYYTDVNGSVVIARYHVSGDPNRGDPGSEQVLLRISKQFPNHNGGAIAFGPDGYLYLGVGDGGSEGDPDNNGQSIQTLFGKLLRIDVDHGSPYSIPPDNPFVKGGGRPEIWAYGLRNPWRFSFDMQTHALYIADVGQDTYEEINYLPAGAPGGTNFGWRYREGMHPYQGTVPPGLKLTDPVYEYTHAQGGCAVIGGYVYRGKDLPAWKGVYLFGDYCSGLIWGLTRQANGAWTGQVLFQTGFAITSFGVDEQGEIYLTDERSGLYKLVPQ
jgi:glucose/arabinose dehydrogenase